MYIFNNHEDNTTVLHIHHKICTSFCCAILFMLPLLQIVIPRLPLRACLQSLKLPQFKLIQGSKSVAVPKGQRSKENYKRPKIVSDKASFECIIQECKSLHLRMNVPLGKFTKMIEINWNRLLEYVLFSYNAFYSAVMCDSGSGCKFMIMDKGHVAKCDFKSDFGVTFLQRLPFAFLHYWFQLVFCIRSIRHEMQIICRKMFWLHIV